MAEGLTAQVHEIEAMKGLLSDWSLPGEHPAGAFYDHARTICRRAERCGVRLKESGEEVNPSVLAYLNRLSDLLWLFARKLEIGEGVTNSLREMNEKTGPKCSRAWGGGKMEAMLIAPHFDEVVKHPDDAVTGYKYFPPKETAMKELVDELFVNNCRHIVVGPCIEGAVFEILFQAAPAVRISDGYLTVDLGAWHFHLCIGEHKGSRESAQRQIDTPVWQEKVGNRPSASLTTRFSRPRIS
jgi:hypothetical protein